MPSCSNKKSASIRDAVRAQVERCAYVESVDAQQDGGSAHPCDSFRKHQWLRQRALSMNSTQAQQQRMREQEQRAVADREALRIQQQLALELERATAAMARQQTEKKRRQELEAAAHTLSASEGRCDASVPLAFEAFIDEIQSGDVDVSCSLSPLPATPFDRLGAISVPSRREGNSLTLCCWHESPASAAATGTQQAGDTQQDSDNMDEGLVRQEQLVVFGGRVLQDIAMLLPAAVRKDPMQYERVRYTYSNAVYAYDIAAGVWRFRECSGRVPRERSDHSAVFLKPHFLVVVGGRGRNGQLFQDLCVLDLTAWRWARVDTNPHMLERYWHACCVAGESVFVFGGKSEVLAHGDLQQLSVSALLGALAAADEPQIRSMAENTSGRTSRPAPPALLSWVCPHTVGKTPSPRFGMALLALDDERIAVVGGYRPQTKPRARHEAPRPPRLMDIHILDTVTMIWSTPRLGAHVSTLTAPAERMLFECFYRHSTIIVFGGFTYETNGETESYTARCDDTHMVYKLDVNHMIWRRQDLSTAGPTCDDDDGSRWLPSAHVHASANAVLGNRAFTCAVSDAHSLLELAAFQIQPSVSPSSSELSLSSLGENVLSAEPSESAAAGVATTAVSNRSVSMSAASAQERVNSCCS